MQRKNMYYYGIGTDTKHTSYRLPSDDMRWLKLTAERLNISQTLLLHSIITHIRTAKTPAQYRASIIHSNSRLLVAEEIVTRI